MKYNWNPQYQDLYDRTMSLLLQAGVAEDFAEVLSHQRCVQTALKKSGAVGCARRDNETVVDERTDNPNVIQFPVQELN